MALCEVALSDGSDLLAEEMKFGLGWNSTSTTANKAGLFSQLFCKKVISNFEFQTDNDLKTVLHFSLKVLKERLSKQSNSICLLMIHILVIILFWSTIFTFKFRLFKFC